MSSFLYFAYGSNLKEERLRVNCCSAELVCTAELRDYALVFLDDGKSSWWRGAVGSVEKRPGEVTWGAVWKISADEGPYLDAQEGGYEKTEVEVVADTGKALQCVTYVMASDLPTGRPSPHYLSVLQQGAEELDLPHEYRLRLQQVQDNGCTEVQKGYPPPIKLF